MKYLQGYSPSLQASARALIDSGRLAATLQHRYRDSQHQVRTERALYDYVGGIKSRYLRSALPISKIAYDPRLQLIAQALGTHSTVSRVQGSRLKSKREIRVASLFKDLPEPFLRMIVVHELAHIREREHDKAFYQLCCHMQSDYHQVEFDLRLVLTHLDQGGRFDWTDGRD